MKIKINDKESYNIDFDNVEEISAEDFGHLLTRLKDIEKIVCKNVYINMSSNNNAKAGAYTMNRVSNSPWSQTREGCIKVLNIHYHSSRIGKQDFAKTLDREWNSIPPLLTFAKKKWNIKPAEVGLEEFPKWRGVRKK